jgi:uncharacterized membrane protein (DUF485 family)
MSSNNFFREFIDFLKQRKKFWLLPIIIFAVFIILLILLASDNALTPFIYDLF